MLTFVPDSFLLYLVNIVFYTGIICTILGFLLRFKFLANYQFILQVVGVLALAFGLYFKGGFEVEQQWRERVKELEAKLAAAQSKSQQVNTVIQEKFVTKIRHIKDTQVKIQKEIVEREKVINGNCEVPAEAIELLNKAAERPVVGEAK